MLREMNVENTVSEEGPVLTVIRALSSSCGARQLYLQQRCEDEDQIDPFKEVIDSVRSRHPRVFITLKS